MSTPSGLPAGFSGAAPASGNGFVLSWGSAGADVTGYEIEARHDATEGPDIDENFHWLTTTAASTTGFDAAGLEPGEHYAFRVRANFEDGTASAYQTFAAPGGNQRGRESLIEKGKSKGSGVFGKSKGSGVID